MVAKWAESHKKVILRTRIVLASFPPITDNKKATCAIFPATFE